MAVAVVGMIVHTLSESHVTEPGRVPSSVVPALNPAKVTGPVATLENMGPGPSYPKESPSSKVTSTFSWTIIPDEFPMDIDFRATVPVEHREEGGAAWPWSRCQRFLRGITRHPHHRRRGSPGYTAGWCSPGYLTTRDGTAPHKMLTGQN